MSAPTRLKTEQCPYCRSRGRDTSEDILAVYPDGHKFCYACGYTQKAPMQTQLAAELKRLSHAMNGTESKEFSLPKDTEPTFSEWALEWFRRYDIEGMEVIDHQIQFSVDRDAIVFPYYVPGLPDKEDELVGYQLRTAKGEWYSFGNIKDLIYTVEPKNELPKPIVVVVEDILSAIKVGRHIASVPVFGSSNQALLALLKRLALTYYHIIFWLDADAQARAFLAARQASLYQSKGSVILTKEDPKAYTNMEILEHLHKLDELRAATY